MKAFAWIFAVAAIGLSAPAAAHDYQVGPIKIGHPWARATTIKVTAAFLTLHNTGKTKDRLIGVSTPAAERAEMHTNEIKNGIARMRKVEAIEVGPGQTTALEPGGLHIMLIGLKYKVKQGFEIPLTLRFEKAGIVNVKAEVTKPGAMKPGATKHGHH